MSHVETMVDFLTFRMLIIFEKKKIPLGRKRKKQERSQGFTRIFFHKRYVNWNHRQFFILIGTRLCSTTSCRLTRGCVSQRGGWLKAISWYAELHADERMTNCELRLVWIPRRCFSDVKPGRDQDEARPTERRPTTKPTGASRQLTGHRGPFSRRV